MDRKASPNSVFTLQFDPTEIDLVRNGIDLAARSHYTPWIELHIIIGCGCRRGHYSKWRLQKARVRISLRFSIPTY